MESESLEVSLDGSVAIGTRDQLASELKRHLDFVLEWLGSFGFTEFEADLSTRPEKYVGDLDLWAIAEHYVNDPYRYPQLARLSQIQNPDRIYPGNRVRILRQPKNGQH